METTATQQNQTALERDLLVGALQELAATSQTEYILNNREDIEAILTSEELQGLAELNSALEFWAKPAPAKPLMQVMSEEGLLDNEDGNELML